MSDHDSELPAFLVEALLSEGPPPDAVDLVKQAWTWRTIDAELMDLSFDSASDPAGVRDAGLARTLEFRAGAVVMLLELGAGVISGQLVPTGAAMTVQLESLAGFVEAPVGATGDFRFGDLVSGTYRVVITIDGRSHSTGAFAIA